MLVLFSAASVTAAVYISVFVQSRFHYIFGSESLSPAALCSSRTAASYVSHAQIITGQDNGGAALSGREYFVTRKSQNILPFQENFRYNTIRVGVWLSLVERLIRVQEAGSSNLLTPTIFYFTHTRIEVSIQPLVKRCL